VQWQVISSVTCIAPEPVRQRVWIKAIDLPRIQISGYDTFVHASQAFPQTFISSNVQPYEAIVIHGVDMELFYSDVQSNEAIDTIDIHGVDTELFYTEGNI
jgi:hypothetical protein